MKTITVEVSEKSYEMAEKICAIRGITFQQMVEKKLDFGSYDNMSSEDFEHLIKREVENKLHREYLATFKDFKIKEVTLKRSGDVITRLSWRLYPVTKWLSEYYHEKQFKGKEGEYYLKLETVRTGGFLNMIDKWEYHFFPTVKMLKRAVNTKMRNAGYGNYYQQKTKEVAK